MKKANSMVVAVMACFSFIALSFIPVSAEPGHGKNKNSDWVNLPQTGQTWSERPGDDGDLQMGVQWPVPRFRDNGDGTVTDNLTKLVWLKNARCWGDQGWYEALDSCNNLRSGFCGLSDKSLQGDWRLPNRNELLSLVDVRRGFPPLPDGHPFINVAEGHYWMSTSFSDTAGAWYLYTYDGSVGYDGKGVSNLVWPVRSEKDDHAKKSRK